METIAPSRTCACTCSNAANCRKAQEDKVTYPGAAEQPVRELDPRDRRPDSLDLDWLDPLEESEFDALRLAWAFMQ